MKKKRKIHITARIDQDAYAVLPQKNKGQFISKILLEIKKDEKKSGV